MEKQKNIPHLRFPEFEKEWDAMTLGNIAMFSKGKGLSKCDISENGVTECIRYGELYTTYNETINTAISKTNINPDELVLSETNDIIIPASGETHIDIAKASCVLKSGVALGGDLNIIRTPNNGVFLSYYLNSSKKQEIAQLAQGISVVHLYAGQLSKLRLNLPTFPEQQKIASFFTAIDKKISQLKQKKTLLEHYKKGVMQKIFSQQIRFKDDNGQEYPKWEKITLGSFLIQKIREVPKPNSPYLAIGVRSHCKGTFQRVNSDPDKIEMDKLFVIKKDDLVVNITFAWEGAIALAKEEDEGGLVSHRFPTYIFNEDKVLGIYFQYVFIQKNFRELLDLISPGGAGRNRVLNKKDFLKLTCNIPKVKEQTKIANFLTAIDDKINHTQKQIEKTEIWKKGLMQQMFV